MAAPTLTLYHFRGCPYCARVERAISALGVSVERRDIRQDPKSHVELLEARGRLTVPVLRIEADEGADRWMPESKDIVRYLYERYGEGRRPPWWDGLNPMVVLAAVAVIVWIVSRMLGS